MIASFTARHYRDKEHQVLGYVGQYLYGRNGRVVTSVGYDFSPAKKDPKGRNFAKASAILGRQLKKYEGQFDH